MNFYYLFMVQVHYHFRFSIRLKIRLDVKRKFHFYYFTWHIFVLLFSYYFFIFTIKYLSEYNIHSYSIRRYRKTDIVHKNLGCYLTKELWYFLNLFFFAFQTCISCCYTYASPLLRQKCGCKTGLNIPFTPW